LPGGVLVADHAVGKLVHQPEVEAADASPELAALLIECLGTRAVARYTTTILYQQPQRRTRGPIAPFASLAVCAGCALDVDVGRLLGEVAHLAASARRFGSAAIHDACITCLPAGCLRAAGGLGELDLELLGRRTQRRRWRLGI